MNIKKAIALMSKSISIKLYNSADGSTWISNGKATYNLGSFPWCESEDELASVLGFTNKQKESHVLEIDNGDFLSYTSGNIELIGMLNLEDLCIANELGTTAFFTRKGETYAVNAALLKPFDAEDITYDLMKFPDGIKVIRVNYGLVTAGYIRAAKINNDIHKHIKAFVKVLNGIVVTEQQEGQDDDA